MFLESKLAELRFWWVRHATVIGNNGCCYGNNDVDCDVSDRESFQVLAKILPKNADVYSSHLKRTIKTMEATIKEGFVSGKYTLEKGFGEQNLGDWQGMKYEKLEEKTKELGIFHPNWLLKTSYTPPNGESYDNLSERVCRSIQRIQEMKKEGDVVIFSHGGPIKAAIGYALGAPPNTTLPFWIDNLAVSRFDYSEGVCRVRFVNLLPKIIANPFSIYHEV